MAERRMFAKSVTQSARFLMLPAEARLLYYDLGMAADDDGVVEAFTVMRLTGVGENALRALEKQGFVTRLNDDLVVYVHDWARNNLIKKDRYHPGIYRPLLESLGLISREEKKAEPPKKESDPPAEPSETAPPSDGIFFGTQTEPEDRLGKDRSDQVSSVQDRGGEEMRAAEEPASHPLGSAPVSDSDSVSDSVTPSLSEEEKKTFFQKGIPEEYVFARAARGMEYARSHGTAFADVILKWWREDHPHGNRRTGAEKRRQDSRTASAIPPGTFGNSFDTDDFLQLALAASERRSEEMLQGCDDLPFPAESPKEAPLSLFGKT